ncbi:proteinase B [Dimargaris verticillata]|uniref:Proteinase B n=1 Tax=Dimargaris verticillata TaxID=2761393 RepID=A0A9W8AZI8_9FUNG|nr:proteinase B [Dimargaris verticillata]
MVTYRVFLVAILACTTQAKFFARPTAQAPLISSVDADTIPENYIVVFKKDAPENALETHFGLLSSFIQTANLQAVTGEPTPNEIRHVYKLPSVKGYAGRFQADVLERIREAQEVAFIEHDSIVNVDAEEKGAPWGLARVSSRDKLSLRNFNRYIYDERAGEGVTAYVVDTGINIEHVDFEGRAIWGMTVPKNDQDIDGNGHGTHVAGTIGGKKYGVAKKVQLVAVKVLGTNGSGTMSDVVKGVEFTVEHHTKARTIAEKEGRVFKGSVANMSLGGGKSRALDLAVDAAVGEGVLYAVAAGNDNRDACSYSPAASELAITVGASTIRDERAYFSNFGKCVDVFAPGYNIESAWIGSKYATNTISGTSMATPHVAGLAAYVVSLQPNSTSPFFTGMLSPKQVKELILKTATPDAISDVKGSPNLLIYNNPPADFTSHFRL